jgi:hypothetical protein
MEAFAFGTAPAQSAMQLQQRFCASYRRVVGDASTAAAAALPYEIRLESHAPSLDARLPFNVLYRRLTDRLVALNSSASASSMKRASGSSSLASFGSVDDRRRAALEQFKEVSFSFLYLSPSFFFVVGYESL